MSKSPDAKPKKRGLLKKILLGVVAALILLLMIARVAAPGIIRGQIESIASKMLAGEVTVEDVDLFILGGGASLQGLQVAAPEGFPSETIFRFDDAGANVALGSLLGNTIVIEQVTLTGFESNLDVTQDGRQSLRTLLQPMLDKMEEPTEPEEPTSPSEEERAPAKGLRIDEMILKDLAVSVRDAYAMETPIESTFVLSQVRVVNAGMPAPGEEAGFGTTELVVEGLRWTAPKSYSEEEIFHLDNFVLAIDSGRLFETMEQPDIVVQNLETAGTRLVLESKTSDDPSGASMREALTAYLNATSLENPQRLDAEDQPDASEKEEKKNLLAGLKSTAEGVRNRVEEVAAGKEEQAEESPEGGEEPAFKRIELQRIAIESTELRQIQESQEDPRILGGVVSVQGSNIVYPHEKGTDANLRINAANLPDSADQWAIDVAGNGALTDTTYMPSRTIDVNIDNFSLAGVEQITSGNLNTEADLEVADGKLSGTMKLNLEKFAYDNSLDGSLNRPTLTTLQLLSVMQLPEVELQPIPLKGISPLQFLRELLSRLRVSATDVLSNASGEVRQQVQDLAGELDLNAESASEAAKKIGENLEGAAEQITGNEDVKKAAEGAKEAAKGIGNQVEGLFGSKKKDEEK